MKKIDELVTYKFLVSIGFGILGFVLNFFPINFYFPNHIASFLWGLIFPMIITLAWNWKFGLVSATIGLGCQTMWFLWLPISGWGPFVTVPPFTLWIVWHGYWNNRKNNNNPIFQNPFIMEIPFRIFNTIILYTLFIWIFQFNPTPWAPSARIHPSMDYIHFIVIKEIINGYIVLLISHVLLNLSIMRRILKLKEKIEQTNTNYIISGFLLLGLIFWLIDGILSYYFFESGEGEFLDLLIFNVPIHTMVIRSLFLLVCMSGGLLISIYLRKQRKSEIKYKEAFSRANFYKDIFAHDIRNILQCIQTSKDILLAQLKDREHREIVFETLNIVGAQVKRGDILVSNVKMLSEIEEIPFKLENVEASEILEESIKKLSIKFYEKKINIHIDSQYKRYKIKANKLLSEIFDNILINAVKHNNTAEIEISIKISKVQKKNLNYIKFEFLDNGCGIPDNKKEIIFRRAHIKDGSIKGIGIGLSLVRKIVNHYKGDVWVEDRIKGDYSKGSNFVALIPEVEQK